MARREAIQNKDQHCHSRADGNPLPISLAVDPHLREDDMDDSLDWIASLRSP
ncbi:MAG: hypothetical protein K0R63_1085 [Rickettsiales bacterium]|jgi:hypothetical protein|nr:hypothetical protein [Rickettsiales bacterium]